MLRMVLRLALLALGSTLVYLPAVIVMSLGLHTVDAGPVILLWLVMAYLLAGMVRLLWPRPGMYL